MYLRDKLGLMEMTSLFKKEVITLRLGGSTDMLLIYGQPFSSSENGPSLEAPFQFEKWFDISDGQPFSSSKNGPDRIVIFIMKMVQYIVGVPSTMIPLVASVGEWSRTFIILGSHSE
jgi:hypothetical protein